MDEEIVLAYRIEMDDSEKFLEFVFSLEKFAMIEDGRVLARRTKNSLSLAVCFRTQEDIYRFWDTFPPPDSVDYEESLPPRDYEETYAPLAAVLPEDTSREILARITKDPEILINFCMGLMERDKVAPNANYVFQLPDEVQEILLRIRARQK